jgi:hypothetical protein
MLDALADCGRALACNPAHGKSLSRRAQVSMEIRDYARAARDLESLAALTSSRAYVEGNVRLARDLSRVDARDLSRARGDVARAIVGVDAASAAVAKTRLRDANAAASAAVRPLPTRPRSLFARRSFVEDVPRRRSSSRALPFRRCVVLFHRRDARLTDAFTPPERRRRRIGTKF